MGAGRLLERLAGLSPAAQASVPALYAWGVTVAPTVWSRGAPLLAKVAAGVALAAIALAMPAERRWGARARMPGLWGFVLSSAVAWSASPSALAPLRIDTARGIAGMLGWGLFAFTFAAPAIGAHDAPTGEEAPPSEQALGPRRVLARGDALYVAGGALLAAWLQTVGWQVSTVERALLVRVVALAAGIALLGAATDIALARHLPSATTVGGRRLRRATLPLAALALLGLGGLLLAYRD